MAFSKEITTNWHDTGYDRLVRPSALLVYMQETANAHMVTFGPALDEMRDKNGLAFVLSRLTLRLEAPVTAYEPITVSTWLSESRGVAFHRHFRIAKADGTVAAEASSVWALIRLADRSFATVNDVPSPVFEEPIEDLLSHRVRLPKNALSPIAERQVLRSECDYNLHMNNTKYPDLVCDYLPQNAGRPHCLSLIWRHEATLGHTLTVERSEGIGLPDDGGTAFYFRTVDQATQDVCLEAEVIV